MENYSVERLDHLGIVAGTIKDLGLIDFINSRLGRYEGETLSIGETVAGMIINGLGFSNKPLSLTPLFFQNCPLPILFRDGVNANDFNRFKLGRVLDRLNNYGTEMLFSEISLNVCHQENIDNRFNHLDTSAMSLSGEYLPDTDEQAIHITYGHSKDHRPDLKQVMVEMMVSQDGGIPMLFKSLDGNSSDNTVFRERAASLLEEFQRSEAPRYLVADCKLYTEKNADNLKILQFITRIPQNIKKVKEVIELAVDNSEDWLELDNDRHVQTFTLEHYGIKQRWHVVFSETSQQQADRRINKKVEKEGKAIKKQIFHLQAQRFSSVEDAIKAGEKLAGKWKTHNLLTYEIVEHKRYKGKGRPKTSEAPVVIKYQIILKNQKDKDAIDRLKKIGGCYVIGTNINQDQLSASEIIDAYREQSRAERGFRFLKDPLFFVSSLFVKKPSRISALLMVMVLSLLVYGIAERRMRACLAEKQETIPNQINKPTRTPTLRWIFQLLSGIHRIKITTSQQISYVFEGINDLKRRIILLFGETVASIYQISPDGTRSM
jgi:transposase